MVFSFRQSIPFVSIFYGVLSLFCRLREIGDYFSDFYYILLDPTLIINNIVNLFITSF